MGGVLFSVRVTQRLHFLNFSLAKVLVVFSPLALFTQVHNQPKLNVCKTFTWHSEHQVNACPLGFLLLPSLNYFSRRLVFARLFFASINFWEFCGFGIYVKIYLIIFESRKTKVIQTFC